MSDKNLRYKSVAIAASLNTGAWAEIIPHEETAKTIIRATAGFQIASSAAPGTDVMPIASGCGYEHDGGASVWVSMPKAGWVSKAEYS